MRPDAPHYLYRCYDADGVLLYIGCTRNVQRRISLHRRDPRNKASRWLRVSMARHEVGASYATRADALAAEDRAIFAEQPLFNRQGQRRPGWMVTPDIAEYLIARGHRELAIETACTCWGEFRDAGVVDPNCAAHIAERRELSEAELDAILSGTYKQVAS